MTCACRASGFLVVERHGIPEDVIDAAWSAAAGFFARPFEEKMAGAARRPRRQSLTFFQNPSFDAEIECLPGSVPDAQARRYESITAGNYLRERFTGAVP